jgi:hypothetical protein
MEKQKTQGAASGRAAADRSLMMNNASSGHKLGQLIGDWYEEYFVFPLLQEVRQDSEPVCFESVSAATTFLKNPRFEMTCPLESYLYQVTYSDGSEFEQSVAGLNELQALHTQIDRLTCHMNALCG